MRSLFFSLLLAALPLLGQTEADFRMIFDSYNRLLRMQQYNATMAILTEEQIRIYAEVPPEQRPMFFGMTYRIPESYKVEYLKVSKDAMKATMLILCTYNTPDKAEMTLNFLRQKDFWRMERPVYGGNPAQRPRPENLSMGSRADYAATAGSHLRGTVLRVTKQDSGAVCVIRKDDEEDAIFVPAPQMSDDVVPGAVLSFRAAPHKSEKLKYWAESASLD